jgi:3',5'-cyclic AMP phosphodiesterase CpdA
MSGSSQKPEARSQNAKLLAIVALALLSVACDWDATQFLFHPTVDERMAENLSGELVWPSPVAVNPDSFVFGVFGDPQVHSDLQSQLGRFADSARAQGLDFFCVLGDLTHDAYVSEYNTVRSHLDAVGIPYFVTIGNHDMYNRGGWERFTGHWGPSAYSVIIAGKLKLIFLDTADGMLGGEQFEWLEEQLEDSLPRHKIVCTHFPMYNGAAPLWGRLARADERYRLLSLLHERGVKAWCSGHVHGFRHDRIENLDHFVVGSMSPNEADLDYGRLGYVTFSLVRDTLRWQRVEFE